MFSSDVPAHARKIVYGQACVGKQHRVILAEYYLLPIDYHNTIYCTQGSAFFIVADLWAIGWGGVLRKKKIIIIFLRPRCHFVPQYHSQIHGIF